MDKTWTQDLLDFLDRSPTCYHAVAELAAKLTAAGYRPLQEQEPWTLAPGQGYFVIRGRRPWRPSGAGGPVAGICHCSGPQ